MLSVTAQTFCLTSSQALIERKGKTFYDYIVVLTFALVPGDGILTTASSTLRWIRAGFHWTLEWYPVEHTHIHIHITYTSEHNRLNTHTSSFSLAISLYRYFSLLSITVHIILLNTSVHKHEWLTIIDTSMSRVSTTAEMSSGETNIFNIDTWDSTWAKFFLAVTLAGEQIHVDYRRLRSAKFAVAVYSPTFFDQPLTSRAG